MRPRLLLTGLIAVIVSACSSSPTPAPSPDAPPVVESPRAPVESAAPFTATVVPGEHNADDVVFAQSLIPHDLQAIIMSSLAPDRAEMPDLVRLAGSIEQVNVGEVDEATNLLAAWGAPRLQPGATHVAAPAGEQHINGLAASQRMVDLGSLAGRPFDASFLSMMIEHHRGELDMARAELARGVNPRARALADSVVHRSARELDELQALQNRS